MILTAIFSCLIGVTVGMFLTYHLLLSYDEAENGGGFDYDDLELELPPADTRSKSAAMSNEPKSYARNVDEIRSVFAKRRQESGRRQCS